MVNQVQQPQDSELQHPHHLPLESRLMAQEKRRREDTQHRLMISAPVPTLLWEDNRREEDNSPQLELLHTADSLNKQMLSQHTVRHNMELNLHLVFLEEQLLVPQRLAMEAPLNMGAV
jgi:hypothetical protein